MALAAVDRLEEELAGYCAYHATRAGLLRRLGRSQQSRANDKAIELAGNTAETAYHPSPRPAGLADCRSNGPRSILRQVRDYDGLGVGSSNVYSIFVSGCP